MMAIKILNFEIINILLSHENINVNIPNIINFNALHSFKSFFIIFHLKIFYIIYN